MDSEATFFQMTGITKSYWMGDEWSPVLRGIDLTIQEGEFLSVLGPSGSGKSTLMNIIGCLDTPTSGEYILHGRRVDDLEPDELARIRNREIGFIFQSFQLLPRQDALSNVELPLVYAGMPRQQRRERAAEMLRRVGLENKMDHLPNQLSGGQQQRVSIARALVRNPAVILADEPTGALDSHTGREVIGMLQQLHREGHTVVLITHDNSIAVQAERIIRLEDGQVVYDGNAHAPEAIVQPTLSGEAAQEEAK